MYHCSIKTVSRSQGRSALGAAAYRAGVSLRDDLTGELHDYTRKIGVVYTEIIAPDGIQFDRNQLWNFAEQSETRKNSTVAREYELALPAELTAEHQKALALNFARHLVTSYGVVADVAVHAPARGGDQRNHHAHILTTTRQVTPEGFGAKTRVLDDRKTGEVERIREAWAELTNQALARAGLDTRVSHKSLEAQGIDRIPTTHLGPAATAMERRGERSDRGDINREAAAMNKLAAEAAQELAAEAPQEAPQEAPGKREGPQVEQQVVEKEKAPQKALEEAQRAKQLQVQEDEKLKAAGLYGKTAWDAEGRLRQEKNRLDNLDWDLSNARKDRENHNAEYEKTGFISRAFKAKAYNARADEIVERLIVLEAAARRQKEVVAVMEEATRILTQRQRQWEQEQAAAKSLEKERQPVQQVKIQQQQRGRGR